MRAASHQQPFVAYPLTQLAVAFAIGIFGTHFFSCAIVPLLGGCSVASLLALTALIKEKSKAATVCCTIAFLLAGACLASMETRSAGPHRLKELLDRGTIAPGDPVELTGLVERPVESAPGSYYFTLRVERLRVKGVERIASGVVALLIPVQGRAIEEDYQRLELRYGARLRVMTGLKRADNFRNPGGSSFTEFLERKGYDATGFVKSPLLIERLDDEQVFLPLAWLYQWRHQLERQIIVHFSPQTAGVLVASLLGNRYFLSHPTAERFREGGTFHVLVISGLHISFIGGLVITLARRITRKRGWQFVLSTTVLWSYTLAVGAEASVVRAALMFTLIAFAPVVARHGASMNALGAAALVLLVWRPGNLFDPSFQLTFLSVLAIVALSWPLLERMSEIGSWRPTRATPHPPSCVPWLRSVCELLFWSERNWKKEIARLSYGYKLFKTPLATKLERYHLQRFLRYAFAAIIVSVSVQLTLLPLLVVYFHRVSLSFFILNIGVSILMAALTLSALVALLLAQLSSSFAAPVLSLTNALNWLMVHSVDPFARLGIASLRLPEYSGWPSSIYALYYLPLLILAISLSRWSAFGTTKTLARRGRKRNIAQAAVFAQLIALILIITHPLSSSGPDGRLHVDFLDVGQGDSALVTMPDGTTLLVDGGGRPDFRAGDSTPDDEAQGPFARDARSVGEAIVSEYLWWRGLDRVDYILATHTDADHMDGLNDVARNFEVRAAIVARAPGGDPGFTNFHQTLSAEGIPTSMIAAGDVLRFGDTSASVLWPRRAGNPQAPSRNNDSIVLKLQFGERTILLTGDVESPAEAGLLEKLKDDSELRADVVKVAHHGSRSSSKEGFVNATRPRLAIISVGQTSAFGHPHKEVVERWKSAGAEVLTTGKCGMITVITDGKDLLVETFAPCENRVKR